MNQINRYCNFNLHDHFNTLSSPFETVRCDLQGFKDQGCLKVVCKVQNICLLSFKPKKLNLNFKPT